MSQKSMTTTTSFTTVSSNESLNKPTSSTSSQLSERGDNMTTTTTTTTANGDQYLSAKGNPTNNNINNNNNPMMINQQARQTNLRLFPSPSVLPPPPPPPAPSSQEAFYGTLDTTSGSSIQSPNATNNFNRQQSNDSGLSQYSNGQQQDGVSMIYGSYNHHPHPANYNSTNGDNNIQPASQALQTSLDVQTSTQTPSGFNQPSPSPLSYQSYQQQHNHHHTTNISQSNNHSPNQNQRSSTSSLDSSSSVPLMPINVKGMLLHGLPGEEVLRNWLVSIKCEDYIKNFADHGYDINLVTRMTPQDLAAIGCKSPALRKKLILEIKKLNIDDQIPDVKPASLDKWLESLKLGQYYSRLISEGFDNVEKVCKITWEDLEEIGITRLGHQKKLLIAIEKVQKLAKLEEDRQNDNAIYDVHPNHRISLNGMDNRMGTLSRVRSGFFQTRSGANLDHRGLPVAKVMPALKHVNSSTTNQQISITGDTLNKQTNGHGPPGATSNNRLSQPLYDSYKINATGDNNNGEETFKMSDLATTLKRNPPPLPPVRTNSLKFPQATNDMNNYNYDLQPIYDNNNIGRLSSQLSASSHHNNNNINQQQPVMATNSTSFLRTPKLGTLTATTNKMLTVGGLIQTISGSGVATMRPIGPIREAPLPPNQQPLQQQRPPPTIHENAEEETSTTPTSQQYQLANNCQPNNNFQQVSTNKSNTNGNPKNNAASHQALIGGSSSLIGHQLASADEFPPPPPCQ